VAPSSRTFSNFILGYTDLENYAMAQRYADKLLQTDVLSTVHSTNVYCLGNLTDYFIRRGQYDQAGKYLPLYKREAANLSMKREEYKACLWSFKADSARKNYLPAMANFRRYYFLKDSLDDIVKTGQLEELTIKYESDQEGAKYNEFDKGGFAAKRTKYTGPALCGI
jgi:hypothetical protein